MRFVLVLVGGRADWESEAPERQDQYGGSIAQSVTSEINIMDDEEKKKSKSACLPPQVSPPSEMLSQEAQPSRPELV